MARLPIKDLKEIAKNRGLTHIIVFAIDEDGATSHIATYGKTQDNCSQAADWGNKLKDVMGWPKSLHQQPSRVRKLQAKIKELEGIIQNGTTK